MSTDPVGPPGAAATYFDHAATTPMLPQAVDAMLPFLTANFANPSGVYATARAARRAIDDARDELGALVGCDPDEIVFTSGGTEADNLAIGGVALPPNGAIVVSAIEHDAVLAPATHRGARVAPVTSEGIVDLDALAELVDEEVALVSVMTVNNETGVIQPIAEVVDLVRHKAPRALVHSDAVQAVAFLDVATLCRDVDLISVSGHKFGGAKGAGALVVRAWAAGRIEPVVRGGPQENELQPGTENVAAIVALGAAAAVHVRERADRTRQVRRLRDRLAVGLLHAIAGASETGARSERSPGHLHLHIPGAASEELLMVLDAAGVSASAGSACASGALEPSHVLIAMGWSEDRARESLRLSLGWTTSDADVDRALSVIPAAVARLRAD